VRPTNRLIDYTGQTLATIDRQVGDRSPLLADIRGLVQQLDGAARSMRLMAEYLERNPSALITGESDNGDGVSARGRSGGDIACGSPPMQVFELSPSASDAPPAAVSTRGGPLICVDKPSVAGYFDRTQMVTSEDAGNPIAIHEF
jgi:hypothetical protein